MNNELPFNKPAETKETPHKADGQFNWLRKTALHEEWTIGERCVAELPLQLNSVKASARDSSVSLPEIFVSFVADPELHRHLRSANGDYLCLAESLLPFAGGYLVRFLSDQQDAFHWYLFINSNRSDHCVVGSYEYFDAEEMDYEVEDLKGTDFQYAADSFEAFFCRYWIEQEVMFAQCDGTDVPDVDPRILALYTSGH